MKLKRIMTVLAGIFPVFLAAACGSAAQAKDPLDGTYYCERIMVYDADGNMRQFLSSEDAGAEDTYLTITDGTGVEYGYTYHGEAEAAKHGSIHEKEESEGMVSAEVYFEGDADKYTLSYEPDGATGKPEKLVLVHHFGENGNYLGFTFSTEKHESKGEPYKDIEDVTGKIDEFETSDTYKNIAEVLNKSYDGFEHELKLDKDRKELVLSVEIPDLSGALGKSSELDSTWNELCGSFDKTSSSIQTVINAGGFKGISFVMDVADSGTTLYRSENGERTFTYEPSAGSGAAAQATPKPDTGSGSTTGGSFESSNAYKQISKIIKESFPDSNPKISYREKDKMLTITLTGGKNWETAVLNDSATYSAWVNYTNSLLNVSASGYDVLCDEGYSDIACTIMVVSYDDPSKALFGCMNGVSYYDFTVD